jgi:hypothetical protein
MLEQSATSTDNSCSFHAFDELLSLDDIFVEYFNEFLQLGAFVQKIEYTRQLNTFVTKTREQSLLFDDDNDDIVRNDEHDNIDHQNVYNDLSNIIQLDDIPVRSEKTRLRLEKYRHTQIMEWIKTERLDLFRRTELYRQYKLCKLLVRPLEIERERSDESGQSIGGYSRQCVVVLTDN